MTAMAMCCAAPPGGSICSGRESFAGIIRNPPNSWCWRTASKSGSTTRILHSPTYARWIPVSPARPRTERLRPPAVGEYVGQSHLLGLGAPLRRALESGRPHSMILWGPPGTGKTTLARLVANSSQAEFIALSAVLAGIKDIRAVVEQARALRGTRDTVLFLDEVHRFNKSQQDTFLPYVEDGTLIFVGATTENPSFEVNNALLSRARVYVLKSLDAADLSALLDRALGAEERGLGRLQRHSAA